jgi:hypothetical protein
VQEIQVKSKFLWVGNWPAIDFINTDIIVEGKPVDLLEKADDVVLWLDESHLCEKTNDGISRSAAAGHRAVRQASSPFRQPAREDE